MNDNNKYKKSLFFGAISGPIAKSIIAPLDRLKIIYQTNNMTFSWYNMTMYSKTLIQREGGYKKLWKGNSVQMLRIAPASSLTYTFQKYFKNKLTDENGKLSTKNGYIVGFLTGISSSFLLYPLDTLRCCIATDISKETTKNIITDIVKSKGIISLYKGFYVSTLGMIPYSSLAWGSMYYLNTLLQTNFNKSNSESHILRSIALFSSVCFAQTFIYPIDVWRRRIQNSIKKKSNQTQIQILSDIIKERSLFKGLTINLVKTPIVNTIGFTIFSILEEKYGK